MRRMISTMTALLLLVSLFSCGGAEGDTPRSFFDAFAARYALMAGSVYDSAVPETDAEYLSDELFHSLYARPDGSDDREDIVSCVIYLGASGTVWYEMAVFRCCDRAAAREVAALCRLRASLVHDMRVDAVDVGASAEPSILLCGTLVVFLALPDNERAERIVARLL